MTAPHPEAALSAREAEKTKARYRLTVDYTNYRGERADRDITPWSLEWGSTDWHPEPGWLVTCYDHAKHACRVYALSGFHPTVGLKVFDAFPQDPAVQAPAGEDEPQHDLWCMHIQGPNELSAAPDFWTALAWSAELNTCVASRAIKQKWAEDDNWPRTQAVVARWPWAAEDHAECLTKELALRAAHEARRKATSPTPTDAQPKAARPVGDEALREARQFMSRAASTAAEQSMDIDQEDVAHSLANWEALVQELASRLSSHPTTGQETVATPRDGGVREAIEAAYREGWRVNAIPAEGSPGAEHSDISQPAAYLDGCESVDWQSSKAFAALSAPGSAGPGAPQIEAKERARKRIQALGAALSRRDWSETERAYEAIRDAHDRPEVYDAPLLATPSPAQEPGTGDTGERKHNIDRYPEAPNLRVNLSTGRLCSDNATTAETRGPADQTKGGL